MATQVRKTFTFYNGCRTNAAAEASYDRVRSLTLSSFILTYKGTQQKHTNDRTG